MCGFGAHVASIKGVTMALVIIQWTAHSAVSGLPISTSQLFSWLVVIFVFVAIHDHFSDLAYHFQRALEE
jgi:hypothetical protein